MKHYLRMKHDFTILHHGGTVVCTKPMRPRRRAPATLPTLQPPQSTRFPLAIVISPKNVVVLLVAGAAARHSTIDNQLPTIYVLHLFWLRSQASSADSFCSWSLFTRLVPLLLARSRSPAAGDELRLILRRLRLRARRVWLVCVCRCRFAIVVHRRRCRRRPLCLFLRAAVPF